MKKFMAMLLALVMTLSLAACGKEKETPDPAPTPGPDPAPTTITAEYTHGFVDMALELPEGWSWETVTDDGDSKTEGIRFYKTDDTTVSYTLLCWTGGYGICGTGVTSEEITLANGMKVWQHTEEDTENGTMGMADIFFEDVPGSYVASPSDTMTTEVWNANRDELLSILGTAQIGRKSVSQQAAIDAAKAPHDSANDADLAQAINDAKAALVNVKALKADIASAKNARAEDYTDDSMAQLNAAVADAEEVLKNGSVDDVAAARAKIADALKALVNVSALKDAIVKAENMDTSNGTDEQKAQLADAIAAAKGLLERGSADEVSAALESLNVAMANFGGSGTDKPGQPEKPGTTGGSQQGGSDHNKKPGKPSKGSGLPGTGDASILAAALAGGSGVTALAAARVIDRKRRR